MVEKMKMKDGELEEMRDLRARREFGSAK